MNLLLDYETFVRCMNCCCIAAAAYEETKPIQMCVSWLANILTKVHNLGSTPGERLEWYQEVY